MTRDEKIFLRRELIAYNLYSGFTVIGCLRHAVRFDERFFYGQELKVYIP